PRPLSRGRGLERGQQAARLVLGRLSCWERLPQLGECRLPGPPPRGREQIAADLAVAGGLICEGIGRAGGNPDLSARKLIFRHSTNPAHSPLFRVIPAQAGIQSVRFRLFPINSCCFSFLDSHFRGNDGISG
ncbi:hypothetical protein FBS57_10965, partial [Neisseria gonorrhoeae]